MQSVINLPSFSGEFLVDTVQKAHAINKNSYARTFLEDISKDGYIPIGIVGYQFSGTLSTWLRLFGAYITMYNGSPAIYYNIRNTYTGTTSASSGTMYFWVLYQKVA